MGRPLHVFHAFLNDFKITLGLLLMALCCMGAHAQVQYSELSVFRHADDGTPIKYGVTLEGMKSDAKALLVIMPSLLRPTPTAAVSDSLLTPLTTRTEPAHYPMTNSRARLLEAGFAMAWVVFPANLGIAKYTETDPRFLVDIEDVLAGLKRQRPQLPLISVSTEAWAMASAMLAVRGGKSVEGQLVLAPSWPRIREEKLELGASVNTLVIHDSASQCYQASSIET
jgi:hypothetical protein